KMGGEQGVRPDFSCVLARLLLSHLLRRKGADISSFAWRRKKTHWHSGEILTRRKHTLGGPYCLALRLAGPSQAPSLKEGTGSSFQMATRTSTTLAAVGGKRATRALTHS
ncbi:hypothetical protein COCVIDRAFT_114424, partial [Bipolaris victoriae FI3]